uniref:Uncharacterized protein n=1 Tax=Acrobeloides nanus TaxID=290746 RepID=A0A914CBE0_9BILA
MANSKERMEVIDSMESAHNCEPNDGIDSSENLIHWLVHVESSNALEEALCSESNGCEQDLITRFTDGHCKDEEPRATNDGNLRNTSDGVDWIYHDMSNESDVDISPSQNAQLEEDQLYAQLDDRHVTINKHVAVLSSDYVTFKEMSDQDEPRGDIRSPSEVTPIWEIDSESLLLTSSETDKLPILISCSPVNSEVEFSLPPPSLDEAAIVGAPKNSNKKPDMLKLLHDLAANLIELASAIKALIESLKPELHTNASVQMDDSSLSSLDGPYESACISSLNTSAPKTSHAVGDLDDENNDCHLEAVDWSDYEC